MSVLRRLWNTLRRPRLDRDIERELAFHLAPRLWSLRGGHRARVRRATIGIARYSKTDAACDEVGHDGIADYFPFQTPVAAAARA